GHANILAAYLSIAVPITLTQLRACMVDRRWGVAGAYLAILLIEIAAIFASMSRAGWFALVAGIVVWILGQGSARRRPLLIGLGVIIAIGVAMTLAAIWVEPFSERLRHLADLSGRWHIWKAAWAVSCDVPLLGCGPDTFQLAFVSHRTPQFWSVEWGTTPA